MIDGCKGRMDEAHHDYPRASRITQQILMGQQTLKLLTLPEQSMAQGYTLQEQGWCSECGTILYD